MSEGFLEYLSLCDLKYSYEQAVKERTSLDGGWEEIKWLSTDIKDLFNIAIENGNLSIIKEIAYLPVAIAWRAIEQDDNYLFQEFLIFSNRYYHFGYINKDTQTKNFLIDRSWRYLKEISEFFINPNLYKETLQE